MQKTHEEEFVPIQDETQMTYRVRSGDLGGRIRVEVTPQLDGAVGRRVSEVSPVIHSGIISRCGGANVAGPPLVTHLEIRGGMFHSDKYTAVVQCVGATDATSSIVWKRGHSRNGPFAEIAGASSLEYNVCSAVMTGCVML